MKKAWLWFLLFLTCIPSVILAQKSDFNNEFGFRSDNDAYLFYGQDRYYTNGLFLTWRHAAKKKPISKLQKRILEVEIGQKIFNPKYGDITEISGIDRPYAGYLYAGAALNLLYKNENSLKLTMQAGILGPAAFGEEIQTFLHKTVGFYDIEGWESQIKNEIAFNASAEYNYFLHRTDDKKNDITFSSYGNLGNTFTAVGAGFLLRTGNINQLYNSAIENAVIGDNSDLLTDKELFFYVKPMINLIVYDGSIEGGLFRKDKGEVTFNAKPLVLSAEAGVMYAKKRFTAAYSLTFKSKEVESWAKSTQYGTFIFYYRFN